MVATVLSISVEVIAADSEYPATDFQPKVVYQDTEYKHTGSASSSSSKKKVKGKVSLADPDYPAANFKPEVLYQDEGYKHTKGSTSSTRSTSKSTNATSESDDSQSAEDSSMSLIIGLALLAAAGFAFYSKNLKKSGGKVARSRRPVKASRKSSGTSQSATVISGSESGVAKYLEGKNGVEPSGVAKYLDEQSNAVSGVSKYVAKQKVTARVASVTGVEKYLKDNG